MRYTEYDTFSYRFRVFMSSLSWGCDSHKVAQRPVDVGKTCFVGRPIGCNLCWVFGLYILVVNWSWQLVWVLVSMKVLRQCLFSSARWWWWSWPIWRPRRLWYKLARYGRKKGRWVRSRVTDDVTADSQVFPVVFWRFLWILGDPKTCDKILRGVTVTGPHPTHGTEKHHATWRSTVVPSALVSGHPTKTKHLEIQAGGTLGQVCEEVYLVI